MMMNLNKKRILVIVAHPDDEVLGIGATMNKLIEEHNCNVRVVILGEGLTSRSETRNSVKWTKKLEQHKNNLYSAQKQIGYHSVGVYDLPDNRFDSLPLLDIVKIVESEKESFKPDIIFTHHSGDLNVDHQKTFESVITATRPLKEEKVKAIITFETPSSTEWNFGILKTFTPNLWIEISKKNLIAKQKAMECYKFEKRNYPHPRSGKALQILAEKRGTEMGFDMSECFCIIRCKF